MHVHRFAHRLSSCVRFASSGWKLSFAVLGTAAVLSVAGCATTQQSSSTATALPTVGRVTLGLPPGDWVHVARGSERLRATGEGAGQLLMKSRAVALRGSQGEVQAVVLVLANADNNPTQVTQWGQACGADETMRVEDRARRSPERVDCLRSRARALVGGWLEKREPAVLNWLSSNQVPLPHAATWVSHQFANRAGMYVAVHVLADPRLLEPKVHDNDSFLKAGHPLVMWSRQLAEAVRVSTGMVDGRLDIPPFPFPQPIDSKPMQPELQSMAAPAAQAASRPVREIAPLQPPASAPAPAPAPERPRRPDRG